MAGAMLITAALAPVSLAAAPFPSAGSATVDGATSDWSLATDFFSDMTDSGSTTKPVRAKLYLRYDCDAEVLYGLVLAQNGEQGRQTRPAEAYLRIDGSGKLVSGNSGNDGTAPDFAWVNGDGTLADGFEASGPLAPGSHTIRAHILVADESADGYTPMDVVGQTVPLDIDCGDEEPTQSTGPTPSPTPSGDAGPTQGTGPTPTPSEAPVGNVGGATGRPRTTLPPTDALASPTQSGDAPGMGIVLVLLAAAAGGFALVTPSRRSRRARPEVE